MLEKVGPFVVGERVRASWLQQMLEALKKLMNIRAGPGVKVWTTDSGICIGLLNPGAFETFKVKVRAVATGGGEYLGRSLSGSSNSTASQDLVMPVGMTVKAADDYLLLNMPENGMKGHRLIVDGTQFVTAIKVGRTAAGLDVGLIASWAGVQTSPVTLAGGTGESAQTDSWTMNTTTNGTAYGGVPVSLAIETRTIYNNTGDKVLYRFTRLFTFNAFGTPISISAETRATINTPGSCTS